MPTRRAQTRQERSEFSVRIILILHKLAFHFQVTFDSNSRELKIYTICLRLRTNRKCWTRETEFGKRVESQRTDYERLIPSTSSEFGSFSIEIHPDLSHQQRFYCFYCALVSSLRNMRELKYQTIIHLHQSCQKIVLMKCLFLVA